MTSFFSILLVYGFQKNCKFFVLFYCMDPRFYKKKLRHLKSKISTKFHCLLFLFYSFSIFGILLAISRSQTWQKIVEFFCGVSKFCDLLFVFYFFYYFWHFIFNFVYLNLSKNARNFYVFLFYALEILSKNFGKSWNIFLKNIDTWNPKFIRNSIVYYLFYSFFAFW